jgi:hypothetical protein
MLRFWLLAKIAFFFLVNISDGYVIDTGCTDAQSTRIKLAMTDALNLAQFTRNIVTTPGTQGNLFQTIFREDTADARLHVQSTLIP